MTDNINDFEWDFEVPEVDFFNEEEGKKPEKKEKEKESEQEEEESEEEKALKEKKKEKELKEEVFEGFITTDEEEEKEESEEVDKKKIKESDFTKEGAVATINFLKEKGMIDFEVEEDEELTEEVAEILLEDNLEDKVELRSDEKVEELFKEMDPLLKKINKFALNGGDIHEFLSVYSSSNTPGIDFNMDMEKEENQIAVMRKSLVEDEYGDEEDINDQIGYLKDSGRLKKVAVSKFKKMRSEKEKKDSQLLKNQENWRKQDRLKRSKLKTDLSKLLSSEKKISGLSFNSKEKRELPKYMTDKNVKLENGNSITELERDLGQVLRNKEKALILAKIIKSDFDFKEITKNVRTKVASKVKENIRRTTPKSAGKRSQTTSLADLLS